jgi:protein phosphatase
MALKKLALGPIKAAACSIKGGRPNNEDAAFYCLQKSIIEGRSLYRFIGVVADGVGGQAKGEIASRIASNIIGSYILYQLAVSNEGISSETVESIVQEAYKMANEEIIKLSYSNLGSTGMATTATTVVVQERRDSVELWVGHVGDSRAYILTRKEIIPLTRDHTLIQEMIEKKQITPEEAIYHPYRRVITKALGTLDWKPEFKIHDARELMHDPREPFFILVCSDGLVHKLSKEEIRTYIIRNHRRRGYTNTLKSLFDIALERGEGDNITAILAGPFQSRPFTDIMD